MAEYTWLLDTNVVSEHKNEATQSETITPSYPLVIIVLYLFHALKDRKREKEQNVSQRKRDHGIKRSFISLLTPTFLSPSLAPPPEKNAR